MKNSRILTETVGRLSLTTSLTEVTQIVAHAAREMTAADGTTFVLRDGPLCHYVEEDAISPLWKGKKFPLTGCISGWSMLNRTTVVIEDIYADLRVPHDAYRPTFVKSLCMVPIRPDDPLGAIGTYWSERFTPSGTEVKLLQMLANSTAIALENLKLKDDISKQSLAKQTFLDCQQEFEVAIQAMAHDLKNPLSTIQAFTELLRDNLTGKVDAQFSDYLDSILDTTNRSAEQIRRMLTLYSLSQSKPNVEPVDLTEMALAVGRDLIAKGKCEDVEFQVEPNIRGYADPYMIRLVLENLISNALKYTSKQERPCVHFGQTMGSGGFQDYFVEDNGVGFDSADSHKLFRPLVRLHMETDFPGTGLGLASVARIIQLHGGKIRAEGQKDKGARISFSLPASG